MLFKTLFSNDGFSLRLPSSHPILTIPSFTLLNHNDKVDLTYQDLYILSNSFELDRNELNKEELLRILHLADMFSIIPEKLKSLDLLINKYKDEFDPIPYLTPDILEIKPDYFIKYPSCIDRCVDIFNKNVNKITNKFQQLNKQKYKTTISYLNKKDNAKLWERIRYQKFLEYCKNNNKSDALKLYRVSYLCKGFEKSCEFGSLELIDFFLSKTYDIKHYIKNGIYKAAFGGKLDIVIKLSKIVDSYDINEVLFGGAKGGHLHIVQYALINGATNFKRALYDASFSGKLNIISYLLNGKDKDNWKNFIKSKKDNHYSYTMNKLLEAAAESGNHDLCLLFINKGADNWDLGLCGSCFSGNLNLVKFFRKNGGNKLNEGLCNAAVNEHHHIIDYLISEGADDLNTATLYAIESNTLNTVKYLIDKGANDLDLFFRECADYGHVEITKYLISIGVDKNCCK